MSIRDIIEAATPGPWYSAVPALLGDPGSEDEALIITRPPETLAWNATQRDTGKPWHSDCDVIEINGCWTSEMGGATTTPEDAAFIATFDPEHIALMEAVCEAAIRHEALGGIGIGLSQAVDTLTYYRKDNGL